MTVAMLRTLRKEQAELCLKLGTGWNDGALVFNKIGEPLKPDTVTHAFSTIVKDIEGISDITLHGLRHTHITHLLMDNVPPKVVSERAGHASVMITLDVYGHVIPDMQQSAAELIDAELQKALAEHGEN